MVTKAFNFSAGTEEEMLATLPPSENENEIDGEDEMVRGKRTSSASSEQVSFKRKSSRLSTGVAMCEKLDRCSHEVIVAKGGKVTHYYILGFR